MEYTGNCLKLLSFWAINGELKLSVLKGQLEEMKAMGLRGTVFHPRYYPGRPAYMSGAYLDILSEIILYAGQLEMEFWIYDENGWPSGSADGHVLEHFPDSRCEWLNYRNGEVVLEGKAGFNTFRRDEMAYFIEYTYDGYRKGLSEEAFACVTGFFSDEVGFLDGHGVSVNMGGIPWCPEAEEVYGQLRSRKLRDDWKLLFTEGEGYEEVRLAYWKILGDILSDAFYKPVNQWCEAHGKRYTAHLKGEETLFFQTSCSGSLYQNLKQINVPAVDALERYPGNHYYPRTVSSLSRQFSDGRCMAEALGGSGWGLSPADLENYVDWLAESGIDTIAFHLWQYQADSASVRDWPPNIPRGLSWKDAASAVFGKLYRKWDNRLHKPRPVLLVAPERGVQAQFDPADAIALNEHNGSGTPDSRSGKISRAFSRFAEHCYEQGIPFDVTSERILEEHGHVEDGALRIGKAVYSAVICGDGAWFLEEQIREQAKAAGIWYEAGEWQWHYTGHGGNQILLEEKECHIPWRGCEDTEGEWRIRSLDPLEGIRAGETQLIGEEKEGNVVYTIPDSVKRAFLKNGEISLRWEACPEGENAPFVYLEGNFGVKSTEGFREKDRHQWETAGDFYLTDIREDEVDVRDLCASGFPFCGTYVEMESLHYTGADGKLRFDKTGLHADCMAVMLDGDTQLRYCWGPEWELAGIKQGIHRTVIRLFPSTFNTYGPHHHIDGDRHLTSPMQYSGEKGFADAPHAPSFTLTDNWHFVKFGI